MKQKVKAIVAVCLVVCIIAGVLFIALSSDTQNIEEFVNEENIIKMGTTDNDVSNSEYTLLLENEHLEFWLNKDTPEFKTVNKANGAEWYSTNQNRENGSIDAAPLHLSYLNSLGGLEDLDVMTGSVAEGKYTIEQADEKITVNYSVGDFSELVLLPYAFNEKRFEEIKNSLEDEFDKMKLIDLYYLTDVNIIEDEDLKAKRLEEYPALKRQKLYIIRDSVREDPLVKKDVAKFFADAGYTDKDYEIDSKYFTPDTDAKKAPGFNIKVEYSLNGASLNVKIPYDGIEMHNEFPMTSLTFAPYFGSPSYGDKGWFLLPDGSGSLMNFHNERSLQVHRTAVYGQECTRLSNENLNDDLGAALPVFGIQNGGYGVLCEISEGDAISQIVAFSGNSTSSAYAHSVFNIRSTYKQTTSTGKKESFVIIQKKRYTGDISLNYHFIDSTDTQLSDMADIVRNSIFGDKNGANTTSVPVMLEQVGMITRQNQFLGVSYNEEVALTEFEQSIQIVEAFAQSGVKNLSAVLSGWFDEGVDHAFLSKSVSAAKKLGGDKALNDLFSKMKSQNIPTYLDADVQYTAKNSLFDGYGKTSNTATMLDQSIGKLTKYNLASFMRDSSKYKYINNLATQLEAIGNLTSTVDKYSVNNISLRTVGSQLFSDYGNPTVDRQEMASVIGKRLKELNTAGYSITTKGANAYALPYINNALEVPVTSSGSDTTDMSVPFLQMVLSGNVNYYAPSINLAGDVDNALLQAVSTGSGFSCIITAQNAAELAGSNQSNLYSTDFGYWKEILPGKLADFQKRLEAVAGKQIVGYEKLAEGVYKTTYKNEVDVIVNYNSYSFEYDDVTVAPKDFVLKGAQS